MNESIFTPEDANTIVSIISRAQQNWYVSDADGNKPEFIMDSDTIDLLKSIAKEHPIIEEECQRLIDDELKRTRINPSMMDIL